MARDRAGTNKQHLLSTSIKGLVVATNSRHRLAPAVLGSKGTCVWTGVSDDGEVASSPYHVLMRPVTVKPPATWGQTGKCLKSPRKGLLVLLGGWSKVWGAGEVGEHQVTAVLMF